MNLVDIFLLVVLFFSAWMGWRRGALGGFADLISWAGSLMCGFLLHQPLGLWAVAILPSLGLWSNPVAFIFLILVGRHCLSFLLSKILPTTDQRPQQKPVNKAFGILPGLINGSINATIIAALLVLLPFSSTLTSTVKEGKAVSLLANHLDWFDDMLSPIFDPAIRETMRDQAVYQDSKGTTNLNFRVTNASPRSDLEMEMLQLELL